MTLKKFFSISIIFVSLFCFSNSAFAVNQVVTATAVIQAATITLGKLKDIDFGTITKSGSPGTVTINASAGAATPTATGVGIAVTGGNSGEVTVDSTVTANVTITYPGPGNLLLSSVTTGHTADQQIAIAQFSTNSTGTSLSVTAGTSSTLHLGGVITLTAAQEAGNYTLDLTYGVNY